MRRPAVTPVGPGVGPCRPLARPVLVLAAIVLPILGAACTGDPADRERPLLEVETGEDGVPTLHIRSLWDTEAHPAADVRLDTILSPTDGDMISLVAPAHAALWGDGRVVLGDAGTRRTWIRSQDGEWSEGPGPWEGPDQIRSLAGVWLGGLEGGTPGSEMAAADGFVVHDAETGELVAFDPAGSAGDRVSVGSGEALHGPGVSTGPWASALHPLADGSWVAEVTTPDDGPDADGILSGTIRHTHLTSPSLDEEASIGTGPALPFRVMGGGAAPLPYAATGHLAAAGHRVATHDGTRARVSLLQVDIDGTLTPSLDLEWHDDAVPVSDSHLERVEAFLLEMAPGDMSDTDRDAWLGTLMDTFVWPEALPPLGDLHLTPSGHLWIGSPLRTRLDMPPRPERVAQWRIVSTDAVLDPEAEPGADPEAGPMVHQVTLPEGVVTVLGPAGPAHPRAVLVLLRDPSDRQGLGLMELQGLDPRSQEGLSPPP